MRRHAKAFSAASTSGNGTGRGLFAMTCLCVFGSLTVLGGSAPMAAAADSCPNAEFRQGPSAHLPDCRAYEQVSPVDKNGNDVLGNEVPRSSFAKGAYPASRSGDAVFFKALGAFAGFPMGGPSFGGNLYLARRGPDGWTTVPAHGRSTIGGGDVDLRAVSTDLRTSWLQTIFQAFQPDPPPPAGASNHYLRDNLTGKTTLAFTDNEAVLRALAGSSDLSHLAFGSGTVLVNDPGVPPFGSKVYEYTNGQVELVSRQPGTNESFAGEASLAGLGAGVYLSGILLSPSSSSAAGAGAISANGKKIFFEVPPPSEIRGFGDPNQLIYRRNDGTTTELASPSRRTPADPEGPRSKIFMRATPDGNNIFFTSSELLTNDANTGPTREGEDLYRYDFAADQLIDISATPGGNGARVQGVIGVSDGGDRVYYAALGQVVPGQGVEGERNVYLWEEDGTPQGTTRFIATLQSTEEEDLNWATGQSLPGTFKAARVTPDGRFLLLRSSASLTGYDNQPVNPIACQGGKGEAIPCPEFFRYDAEASGGGALLCVSCSPSGEAPLGPAMPATAQNPDIFTHVISDDGRYVFFNSPDPLVPTDTNNKVDAYEWANGETHLLSSGTGPGNSSVLDATPDGSKIFIATRDSLVPQDIDHNVDMYVASVNGGLASQQAPSSSNCDGDGCQGAAAAPPPASAPLSSRFSGQGNVKETPKARRCAKGKRKVKGRCVSKRKRHASKDRKRAANRNRGGSK